MAANVSLIVFSNPIHIWTVTFILFQTLSMNMSELSIQENFMFFLIPSISAAVWRDSCCNDPMFLSAAVYKVKILSNSQVVNEKENIFLQISPNFVTGLKQHC